MQIICISLSSELFYSSINININLKLNMESVYNLRYFGLNIRYFIRIFDFLQQFQIEKFWCNSNKFRTHLQIWIKKH